MFNILKTVIIYSVTRLFGLNNRQAIATGITLGQVGEFSFVLAASARVGGVLDSNTIDLIISVIIVLMLATPYMVSLANPVADGLVKLFSRRRLAFDIHGKSEDEDLSPTNRVLVVGLGPAGRQVVETFLERKLEPVVIDVNPKSREYAQQVGIKIHLGDASHEEILLHAGLSEVCMTVITVPDPTTSIGIIKMIRRLRPELNIVARCRYNLHLADLEKAGADMVIDEETTMGQMLSQKIIENIEESSGSILACRLGGQTPDVSEWGIENK